MILQEERAGLGHRILRRGTKGSNWFGLLRGDPFLGRRSIWKVSFKKRGGTTKLGGPERSLHFGASLRSLGVNNVYSNKHVILIRLPFDRLCGMFNVNLLSVNSFPPLEGTFLTTPF